MSQLSYEARGQNRFTLYLSCDILLFFMTRNLQKDSDNKGRVSFTYSFGKMLLLFSRLFLIIVLKSSFCYDSFSIDCEGHKVIVNQ